jgi:hypothetical protein
MMKSAPSMSTDRSRIQNLSMRKDLVRASPMAPLSIRFNQGGVSSLAIHSPPVLKNLMASCPTWLTGRAERAFLDSQTLQDKMKAELVTSMNLDGVEVKRDTPLFGTELQ